MNPIEMEELWRSQLPNKTDRIKIFGQSILRDLQTKIESLETEIHQKKGCLECKKILSKAGIISLMELGDANDESPLVYVGQEMSWFAEEIVGMLFENQVQELEKELRILRNTVNLIEGKVTDTQTDLDSARLFPVMELVEAYVDLKRNGSGKYRGLCPFHDDRNPSFFVFEKRNRFRCFGCGASGDAIQFLMQIKQIKFKRAVKALCALSEDT